MKIYCKVICLAIISVCLSGGFTFAAAPDANAAAADDSSDLNQRMQKRISVDFRNTPIEDVLRIMADQSSVDIIMSPKVQGNVNATLNNIPLEEALNNILATNACGYVRSNNMIRVMPITEMSEVTEKIINKNFHISYADVVQVADSLKKFLSPRGSMMVMIGTSDIMVSDAESKLYAVGDYIKEVDRITPQIEVEARIYDITSKDNLDIGVQWAAGHNTAFPGGFTNLGVNPTGQTDPFTTGTFLGATGKTAGTTGAIRFGWLGPGIDIDVLVQAQKNNIDAKLLANPRILVLDNEKANIKIISQIPYQELTQTSGGGSIGTIAFREVGVQLTVIPHLTRDRIVRMQLQPEFSVQTGTVDVGTEDKSFPQPVIDTRTATTTLLVEDGRTIVLGGLRKRETSNQINKIPFLGDLPVAGYAFKFHGESTVMSELVVFVTPRIMENASLDAATAKQLKVTNFPAPPLVMTDAEKALDPNEKAKEKEKLKDKKNKKKNK